MSFYRWWNGPNRGRWPAVAGGQFVPNGIANSTKIVLFANPARTYAIFVNTSDTDDIFIQLGADATTSDLKLLPGGFYEMTMEAGNVWDGQVDAITSVVGPVNLAVLEIAENS